MRKNKLFRRTKAKNGSGRTVKVKHILLPEEVVEDLKLIQACYGLCFSTQKDENGNPLPIRVTYEQMFRRWMDNIGRFDPDVKTMFIRLKDARQEEQKRLATDLGLTPEQLEANQATFNPADPENKPWELKYYFEKDGNEVQALYGQNDPFYARINGIPKGMDVLLKDGWILQNELGVEIDSQQAAEIRDCVQEHFFSTKN